jgi:hypothetical protein
LTNCNSHGFERGGLKSREINARHLAHFHTRNGKGRRYGLPAGVDRSLHLDQRPHPKPARREPAVGGGGIGHSEGNNMHAGMARETGIEFAGEGSVRGLEQDFDIAARKHRGDVAGASQPRRSAVGIWIDLNRYRRGCKAGARQRMGCCFGIHTKWPT